MLRYLSWGVLVVCAAMTLAGAWRIAATTDEPFHVQRFDHYLETGWYLGDGQLDHGRPSVGMTQQYVYGPAAMLILHGVNAVVGVEPWGRAGTSADAYGVRHLGVGVIGLLGVLAVVLTGRVLFRRWDWGVLAGAVMVAVPLWTGHAMFNVKDVPVATGYAWATLGLVVLAREREAARWWVRWGGPVVLVAGVVLSVGTRPAMWSGIAFGALVLVGCRLLRREPETLGARLRADLWVLRDLAAVVVASGLLLWWMDPKVFGSPVTALVRSVRTSSTFRPTPTPWFDVPEWIAQETPLVVIVFFVLAVATLSRHLALSRLRPDLVVVRWVVVAVQAVSMPIGVIVTESPIYGDLRQLMFSVPAVCLLAVLGISWFLSRVRTAKQSLVCSASAPSIAVALVVPVVMQAMLFPYNYVYFNPLAWLTHLQTNGDYLRGSANALGAEVPARGRLICVPEQDRNGSVTEADATRNSHLSAWLDCRTAPLSPVSAYSARFRGPTKPLAPDEFWATSFDPEGRIARNCTRVAGESRRTPWQRISLETLSLCRLPFPTLPEEAVVFARGDLAASLFPDEGWNRVGFDQTRVGLVAAGRRSTMTFRLPDSARGHAVGLQIRTAEPADPMISFGGEELPAQSGHEPGTLVVEIPRELVDRAVAFPLTLAFESRTLRGLDLKVLSLSAVLTVGGRRG